MNLQINYNIFFDGKRVHRYEPFVTYITSADNRYIIPYEIVLNFLKRKGIKLNDLDKSYSVKY